jgi:hypothetical protein
MSTITPYHCPDCGKLKLKRDGSPHDCKSPSRVADRRAISRYLKKNVGTHQAGLHLFLEPKRKRAHAVIFHTNGTRWTSFSMDEADWRQFRTGIIAMTDLSYEPR